MSSKLSPPTTPKKTPTAAGGPIPVRRSASKNAALAPPAVTTASARRVSAPTAGTPLATRSKSSAAAKRKTEPPADKDALISALKDQVAALESKLNADPESAPAPVTPANSLAVQIAELQLKVKTQDLLIHKLEAKVTAFVSKNSAVAFLTQEKEANEARLEMIIKDKDETIETMRKQIEMQVSGLFAEVTKSRDLLVQQNEAHEAEIERLNATILSQATELSNLRESMKQE
ncbi:hypothetical protein HDU84_002112 [Entophlyctis sp. JEL0112]|nr:hypothetical protein HDU84_002112 [Entophlyctis sp. JEL0112]